MKTLKEIKKIINQQDEMNMLNKPESLTTEEYNYFYNVEGLKNEILLLKEELRIKRSNLKKIKINPNYYKNNEGI
jgi:hypothetical protein